MIYSTRKLEMKSAPLPLAWTETEYDVSFCPRFSISMADLPSWLDKLYNYLLDKEKIVFVEESREKVVCCEWETRVFRELNERKSRIYSLILFILHIVIIFFELFYFKSSHIDFMIQRRWENSHYSSICANNITTKIRLYIFYLF